MTKLDDVGARASAHLRSAVRDHLDAHPVVAPRPPRVPRSAVALGVVVAVALGGALLASAPPGTTRLQAADDSEATDAGNDVTDSKVDVPTGPGSADSSGPAESEPGSPPRPSDPGTQSTTPTTLPGQSPPPADTANEPASEETLVGTCSQEFDTGNVGNSRDWCVEGGNQQARSEGHPLMATVCRNARNGDAALHFARRQEADFMVTDARGREVWRWSRTRPAAPHVHQRDVKAGSCITWGVVWNESDQSGSKVPDGNYRLRVTVLADEIRQWVPVDQDVRVGRT